jgi:hypothetical protein
LWEGDRKFHGLKDGLSAEETNRLIGFFILPMPRGEYGYGKINEEPCGLAAGYLNARKFHYHIRLLTPQKADCLVIVIPNLFRDLQGL